MTFIPENTGSGIDPRNWGPQEWGLALQALPLVTGAAAAFNRPKQPKWVAPSFPPGFWNSNPSRDEVTKQLLRDPIWRLITQGPARPQSPGTFGVGGPLGPGSNLNNAMALFGRALSGYQGSKAAGINPMTSTDDSPNYTDFLDVGPYSPTGSQPFQGTTDVYNYPVDPSVGAYDPGAGSMYSMPNWFAGVPGVES